MDILWNNPIIGGIGGAIFGGVVLVSIPIITRSLFNMLKTKAIKKIEETLTCPEWKEIINLIIDKVQKDMATDAGKERMLAVVKKLQAIIPGSWDDAIIASIVQTIYDEAQKDIEIK